ncbi:MAG TPA: sugar phosphorylase [Lachnospiraceae bacterium]|nr:sugar phosphorylase [Lachnospiraceae bacterium]
MGDCEGKRRELLGRLYTGEDLALATELMDELLVKWGPRGRRNACPLTEKDCMLIAYGDSIQEEGRPPLAVLDEFIEKNCGDEITNVHLLPVFPYTSDDGFSVSDYLAVSPDLGSWDEVETLGKKRGIMMDAVINHTSKSHAWFKKCCAGEFPYTRYYIECDPREDYSRVTRPRALPLLTPFETSRGKKWYWTTFSEDQVDLNYGCPYLLKDVLEVLLTYAARGARFIRLDAIGFAWKRPGTTCMHLAETHALIRLMRLILTEIFPGTCILTETNVPHKENISYFGRGDEAHMVYQFPLPPLVLHTMLTGDTGRLSAWARGLSDSPLPEGTAFFNFLASHDGIGVRPVEGILTESELQALLDAVSDRGGRISYKQNADGSKSPYELNINYLDAVSAPGEPEETRAARFLASQAIMLSLQGMPGIYYHSLLGSGNWQEGAESTGISRRINREKLSRRTLEEELHREGTLRNRIFMGYLRLLRARGGCGAFAPHVPQEILDYGSPVFALRRCPKGGGHAVLALINVTGKPVRLAVPVQGKDVLGGGAAVRMDRLKPYQTAWLEQPGGR